MTTAHRRTKITLDNGNHWNIDSANGYNDRGEVIKAYKILQDRQPAV